MTDSIGVLNLVCCFYCAASIAFIAKAGDRLLTKIGQAISASLKRPGDLGARYGGDEFTVLLPGSHVEDAAAAAQQVRHAFVTACYAEGISGRYSRLSIGVASLVPGSAGHMRDLVAAADEALYQAKREGRNRVVFKDSDDSEVETGNFKVVYRELG